MSIQNYLDKQVANLKKQISVHSDQLNMGQLLDKLTPLKEKYKVKDDKPNVLFDFCQMFPIAMDSWRGDYTEICFNYSGWDGGKRPVDIEQFWHMVNNHIDYTLEGYKGGQFKMTRNTPVWVANHGDSGNTAVLDVLDMDYEIIIVTGYRSA